MNGYTVVRVANAKTQKLSFTCPSCMDTKTFRASSKQWDSLYSTHSHRGMTQPRAPYPIQGCRYLLYESLFCSEACRVFEALGGEPDPVLE